MGHYSDFRVFEPAARLKMGDDLSKRRRTVGNAALQCASVYEVETRWRVGLLKFQVIYLELQIRRHEIRLNWRQVGPNHGSCGMLVCKLHGRDAGAVTQVEYSLRCRADHSDEEAAA